MRSLLAWTSCDDARGWRAEAGRPASTLLGPAVPAAPFTAAVPSWSAATPAGSWIEVQLRVGYGERWSQFYRIAQWDDHPAGSMRQSFGDQRDADGHVATDTLVLQATADAIQPRILLHATQDRQPSMRGLWIALSGPPNNAVAALAGATPELAVPPRAQLDYPDGPNICSPTSVAMLLAYWYARTGDARLARFGERQALPEVVAPLVYDPVYEGHGNWGFNTAFAASLGLRAYVARFASLSELAPWVAAGVPPVISVAWGAGALDGAPIPASNGHLLVVAGFDGQGGVIVADPRGDSESEVRRVYAAGQLERAWQNNSAGTTYLVYPPEWPGLPQVAA
jgi:hypothetical protein